MKTTVWRERLLSFCLGAVSVAVLGLLLGAASDHQSSTPSYGRYQLSTWATRVDDQSALIGAFVTDTVSGETRAAYIRSYGNVPDSKVLKNGLNEPFAGLTR